MKLEGRVAAVTGGSAGIGRGIAEAYLAEGASVAVMARNAEKAEKRLAEVGAGDRLIFIQGDAMDQASVEGFVDQTAAHFGQVDILINNAGITRDGLLMRMKSEQWDDVLNTNLKGVFLCTKYASKFMMKKRSGSIVNISSVVGIIGNPGQANYSAAKAGVIGFTKTCAKEFASRGINVNAIAPGFIETEMTEKLDTEEILKVIPLGKLGSCTQIANLVSFLVSSDAGSYITGQTISIDGGMSI